MNKHKTNRKHREEKCPVCGSDNVAQQKQASWMAVLSLLFIMIPLPISKKSYHCFECGHNWK